MSAWDSTGLSPKDQPRFDYVNRDQIPEELKEVFDSIVGSQRGVGTLEPGPPGPLQRMDVHRPRDGEGPGRHRDGRPFEHLQCAEDDEGSRNLCDRCPLQEQRRVLGPQQDCPRRRG